MTGLVVILFAGRATTPMLVVGHVAVLINVVILQSYRGLQLAQLALLA